MLHVGGLCQLFVCSPILWYSACNISLCMVYICTEGLHFSEALV